MIRECVQGALPKSYNVSSGTCARKMGHRHSCELKLTLFIVAVCDIIYFRGQFGKFFKER